MSDGQRFVLYVLGMLAFARAWNAAAARWSRLRSRADEPVRQWALARGWTYTYIERKLAKMSDRKPFGQGSQPRATG